MLKIDMHVHTWYSDSEASVSEVLMEAERKGLDGLAITDHWTIKGAIEAMKKRGKLIIIPGQEIETKHGEILALGIKNKIRAKLSIQETIKRIHAQGGLAIVPHPTIPLFSVLNEEEMKTLPLDGIEVFSAITPIPGYFLRKNIELARRLRLSMVAGSDSHYAETVGDAYTIIYCRSRKVDDILRTVKLGRTSIGGRSSGLIFKWKTAKDVILHTAYDLLIDRKFSEIKRRKPLRFFFKKEYSLL
ncbi:CehA/McbA family metallohydrolase [Candidatus Bathyarchaeota archaeon]|nr:CehA/McbA family metallohydrolase [Candidatus Bathyarchaeota archaeon]